LDETVGLCERSLYLHDATNTRTAH